MPHWERATDLTDSQASVLHYDKPGLCSNVWLHLSWRYSKLASSLYLQCLQDSEQLDTDLDLDLPNSDDDLDNDTVITDAIHVMGTTLQAVGSMPAQFGERGPYNQVEKCSEFFEKALSWSDWDFHHTFWWLSVLLNVIHMITIPLQYGVYHFWAHCAYSCTKSYLHAYWSPLPTPCSMSISMLSYALWCPWLWCNWHSS